MDRRAPESVHARRVGARIEQHAHRRHLVPIHGHRERRFARALARCLVVEIEIELRSGADEGSETRQIVLDERRLEVVALFLQRRLCAGTQRDTKNQTADHASSLMRARTEARTIFRSATAIGSVNRRGPALPGLTYSTPPFSLITGLCEWPEITTRAFLSSSSSAMSCSTWMARPPSTMSATSGTARAQRPLSLLPRTAVTG